MIRRPDDMNAFEFVILSGLRAAQLMRGCVPRVEGVHKRTITAQLEVAQGLVAVAPEAVSENRDPGDTGELVAIDNY